jgi:hypothetical protein
MNMSEVPEWEIEVVSSPLVFSPDADLALVAERLIDQARADGVALAGLVQQVLLGLETEVTDHFGHETHAVAGRGSGKTRNGWRPMLNTLTINHSDRLASVNDEAPLVWVAAPFGALVVESSTELQVCDAIRSPSPVSRSASRVRAADGRKHATTGPGSRRRACHQAPTLG